MSARAPAKFLVAAGLLALSTACGSLVQVPSSMQADQGMGMTATPGSDPAVTSGGTRSTPSSPSTGLGAGLPGSDGTGSSSGSTSTSDSGSSNVGAAPADVHGPVKIGFLYPSNGRANSALGVATSASSDPKQIMGALVSGLNQSGGLNGRKLVVEYATIDSTSSDYSTEANVACAHFTEDVPVPVVIDLAFGNRYGMAKCLAKHGVADFGTGTSDTVDDNEVGLFASPTAMTSTRRYPAVLKGLHSTGYLTSQNKIGVVLEGCPPLQRAYHDAVLPEISRLGLNRVDTEQLECTTGFASAGPASSAVSSAVLRFRSHDVDRLLLVSNYEQVVLLLLANNAESQGWRPGYMLSSTAQTEVMRPNIPSGQWPQLHGIGWVPGYDIDDPHQPAAKADQRCLDLIKQGGLSVTGWQNTLIATLVCSEVFFLEASLKAANGNAQGNALMAGVESLGGKFVSPGIVDGRTFFGPDRRDGPAAAKPFGYDASCRCLKYTGAALTFS